MNISLFIKQISTILTSLLLLSWLQKLQREDFSGYSGQPISPTNVSGMNTHASWGDKHITITTREFNENDKLNLIKYTNITQEIHCF